MTTAEQYKKFEELDKLASQGWWRRTRGKTARQRSHDSPRTYRHVAR